MKRFFLLFILIFFFGCGGDGNSESNLKSKACVVSEDFIKKYMTYPEEADFSSLRCTTEAEGDDYVVMSYVISKNALGVKTKIMYKIWLRYQGGDELDAKNWIFKKIILEDENGKQTLINNSTKDTTNKERKTIGNIDGIECIQIEENIGVFRRIVTSKELNKNQIEKFLKKNNITEGVVQFCLPGKEKRGEEYASKTGETIFIY